MTFEVHHRARGFYDTRHRKGTHSSFRLERIDGHHYAECAPYRNIIEAAYGGRQSFGHLEEIPYLPATLFKRLELAATRGVDHQQLARFDTKLA